MRSSELLATECEQALYEYVFGVFNAQRFPGPDPRAFNEEFARKYSRLMIDALEREPE
jgi:hypothetical protein